MLHPELRPFEGESCRAYGAFVAWAGLPPHLRSLRELARTLGRLPSWRRSARRWRYTFCWDLRAAAVDVRERRILVEAGGRELPPEAALLHLRELVTEPVTGDK
ncbi:MAG: hypothetical protein RBU30_14825 [Polyangia bacterium]|jgi:hypothetical protein|nr:hypothetical protein [Polyangia bacterium]